jgi:hypothetical protein
VDIHSTRFHIGIELPYSKKQVIPGLYPALSFKEIMEKVEFGECEINFFSRYGNAVVILIKYQVS